MRVQLRKISISRVDNDDAEREREREGENERTEKPVRDERRQKDKGDGEV